MANRPVDDDLPERVARSEAARRRVQQDARDARRRNRDLEPLDYRTLHDPLGQGGRAVKRHAEQLPDVDGNIGTPHRVYDTVGMLFERGAIDQNAHASAMKFRDAWDRAHLDPLRAADLDRMLGDASHGDLSAAAYRAREEVWKALQHLGGTSTPIGLAAWYVLGFGQSIKEFAELTVLGPSRAIDRKTAKGLVIGACCVLESFYRT